MKDVKFHLTRQLDGRCFLSLVDTDIPRVISDLHNEDDGRLERSDITPLLLQMLSTAYHAGVERGIRAATQAASAHWEKRQAMYAPSPTISRDAFDDYLPVDVLIKR